jgi:hypothetical protein
MALEFFGPHGLEGGADLFLGAFIYGCGLIWLVGHDGVGISIFEGLFRGGRKIIEIFVLDFLVGFLVKEEIIVRET